MSSSVETTIRTDGDMKDDSPSVVAYRVSQLELAQKENTLAQKIGFEKLSDKIDAYARNFVAQSTFDDVKLAAELEHKDMREETKELRKELNALKAWRDKIIGKIAGSAVIALVLMVLTFYGLDKLLK